MRERINKPRVFLSHARKDVAFIERVERDLRKQLEPWLDANEIRDGQPWMSAILEDRFEIESGSGLRFAILRSSASRWVFP